MEVRAHHRHARMSPRKVRLLRPIVRGLSVADADAQLTFMPGKAAKLVLQVLRSAVANAEHNHAATRTNLKIADLVVNEGLVMKRIRPVSRGMAHAILKRTSHITVVVEETGATKRKKVQRKAAQIETITAAELIKEAPPAEAVTEPTPTVTDDTAVSAPPRNKEMEAYNIKKMQQQGGDPKKSHRRKSM